MSTSSINAPVHGGKESGDYPPINEANLPHVCDLCFPFFKEVTGVDLLDVFPKIPATLIAEIMALENKNKKNKPPTRKNKKRKKPQVKTEEKQEQSKPKKKKKKEKKTSQKTPSLDESPDIPEFLFNPRINEEMPLFSAVKLTTSIVSKIVNQAKEYFKAGGLPMSAFAIRVADVVAHFPPASAVITRLGPEREHRAHAIIKALSDLGLKKTTITLLKSFGYGSTTAKKYLLSYVEKK